MKLGCIATALDTLTIRPNFAATMSGTHNWHNCTAPSMLAL